MAEKRGRPRLSEEEKQKRAEMRKNGELPAIKRPDMLAQNRGMENIEPGDNSRYLAHALATASLPPIDISDIEQVKERINWYYKHCFDNDMKPTVAGFCSALKIARQTLLNWKTGSFRADTHQAVILEAYGLMEELWENYMQNGKINPVSGIFLAKNNWGYQDKQEMVVTPNTTVVEPTDAATIEAKYAELPED